jgi:hypothetical protein
VLYGVGAAVATLLATKYISGAASKALDQSNQSANQSED